MAKVNIKPLEDKILVQANEAETTTASGLVIPDTAKEKPQEGTVVAVGPGRWDEDGEKRIPLDVAEGDTVIYSKYGGTEIKYNADIPFLHLVSDVDAHQVRMGMRVEAVWKPRERWGLGIDNIEYFRPTGEPDANYDTYKHHL